MNTENTDSVGIWYLVFGYVWKSEASHAETVNRLEPSTKYQIPTFQCSISGKSSGPSESQNDTLCQFNFGTESYACAPHFDIYAATKRHLNTKW
jgi:hypothetical protein